MHIRSAYAMMVTDCFCFTWKASHFVQMPSQAYVLPITSSQEYGWRPKPLSPASAMFQYRKTKCDVTDYAEAYAASMGGESPYMHTNPAKAAAAK